jgi:hypothetical protein
MYKSTNEANAITAVRIKNFLLFKKPISTSLLGCLQDRPEE